MFVIMRGDVVNNQYQVILLQWAVHLEPNLRPRPEVAPQQQQQLARQVSGLYEE